MILTSPYDQRPPNAVKVEVEFLGWVWGVGGVSEEDLVIAAALVAREVKLHATVRLWKFI